MKYAMEEIVKNGQVFLPYRLPEISDEQIIDQSRKHYEWSNQRRSILN